MDTRQLSLLIVEDDNDHAELIQSMLERKAPGVYKSERATSASAGVELMNSKDFDVILLDLSLPDSGPENTLKTFTEAFPMIPVVVLTSLEDEKLAQHAIEWGAQDYLDKSTMRADIVMRAIQHSVDRKRIQTKLEQQNEELKNFAHTVAHEFKSPLQSILTAFCLIEESAGDSISAPLKKLVTLGVQSSERLSALVNDILAFAESDLTDATTETIDMDPLVREVVGSLQAVYDVEGTEFEIQSPLPSVRGARPQIRQVMHNLLANAVKYSPREGRKISVRAETRENFVVYEIEDNGIGISPENQKRIFEPFFRVHRQEEYPGTGIGLGFCKGIIERHGGDIWVESELGKGTKMSFSLPLES